MSPGPGRRRVLAGAGALAAGTLAAACTDAPPGPAPAPGAAPPAPATSTVTPPPRGATYPGDLAGVALGAALAALAAELYDRAEAAATGGRYGPVPDVVTVFLEGARAGQRAAATDWNALLTAAGRPAVSGVPLSVAPARRAALERAVTPADVLALAADLETAVARTLVAQVGLLLAPAAIALGATLAPVAAARAATATFLLGRAPGAPPGAGATRLDRSALTV